MSRFLKGASVPSKTPVASYMSSYFSAEVMELNGFFIALVAIDDPDTVVSATSSRGFLAFLFFSATILVPWLFSIPLARVSSNRQFGKWLAGTGVFACRRSRTELGALKPLLGGNKR